ncbi:MAG: hypothetical protein ABI080_13760 [Candidatus Binatia bacterium]
MPTTTGCAMIDAPSVHHPRLRVVEGGRADARPPRDVPRGLIVQIRKTPLQSFVEWLESLGPHLRDEIAVRLLALAPSLLGDVSSQSPSVELTTRVQTLAQSTRAEVGTMLMLAPLVDFVFRGRSASEHWEAIRAFEERAAAGLAGDTLAARAQREAERIPLRARAWQRAFTSWEALRNGQLSVAAIENYLEETDPLPLDS